MMRVESELHIGLAPTTFPYKLSELEVARVTFETGIIIAAVATGLVNVTLCGRNLLLERRLRNALRSTESADAAMVLARERLEAAAAAMAAAREQLDSVVVEHERTWEPPHRAEAVLRVIWSEQLPGCPFPAIRSD